MPTIPKLDNLDRFRNDEGKLVDIGLGCYAQAYACPNGDALCADCAEKSLRSLFAQGYSIGEEPTDAFSTADTDARVVCANCDRVLSEGYDDGFMTDSDEY